MCMWVGASFDGLLLASCIKSSNPHGPPLTSPPLFACLILITQLDFVGLKTKEEFKSLKDAHEEQLQKQHKQAAEEEAKRREREEKLQKKKAKESKVARLSFALGDDGDGDEDEDGEGPAAAAGKKDKKDGERLRACAPACLPVNGSCVTPDLFG
jgi:hypothetical protein